MPDVLSKPTASRTARVRSAASLVSAAVAVAGWLAPTAHAQDQAIASLESMHEACAESDDRGEHDHLYSVVLDSGAQWSEAEGDEDGEVLFVLSRASSLRSLGGRVQLVPSHLERVGFVASAERARVLEAALDQGARVRLGFFLGFDEPERRSCLVRPTQGVTAVRADVAFIELVGGDGSVLAREDNDRLRSWLDDPNRHEGSEEPRADIGAPTAQGIAVPEAWTRALRAPALSRALLACHVAGVARGATREAMVQLRLRVDGRTGRSTDTVVEVGNTGDEAENACIVDAVSGVALGAASAGVVDVRLPITLRAH